MRAQAMEDVAQAGQAAHEQVPCPEELTPTEERTKFKQARVPHWLKPQRPEVKTGEADKVLAELSRVQPLRQQSHVESAVELLTNKLVVQSRLKGAGMRWEPDQVNAMLALRNLACHDRWDQGWQAIRQRLQQEAQAQRRQRAGRSSPQAADEPASPAALPVQTPPAACTETLLAEQVPATQQTPPQAERTGSHTARPAATHPWRRPFLRRRLA